MADPISPICVAALYQFTRFDDCTAIRSALLGICRSHGIKGTLLLAREGINGTVAGTDAAIAALIAEIRTLPGCGAIDVKYARAAAMPFHRLKVRLKAEIVTMGQPDIDPLSKTGHYVAPQDWNALIAEPGTILIDTRNDYEVAIGTFTGAIDPKTASFRDFPAWFRAQRADLLGQGTPPKVAMFCTGGIRCEKSTAFLKAEGIDEVYHLQGGILKYLEEVPPEQSSWQGECFVFDERVTVNHHLEKGQYDQCHACRMPITEADKASAMYGIGVSCPHCYGQKTAGDKRRFAEREKQIELAKSRGENHIGSEAAKTLIAKREAKLKRRLEAEQLRLALAKLASQAS